LSLDKTAKYHHTACHPAKAFKLHVRFIYKFKMFETFTEAQYVTWK